MAGWAAAGLDAIECLRNAVSVTKDWVYDPDPGLAYDQRIKPRRKSEKLVSVKWRDLGEILNPQPRAQQVIGLRRYHEIYAPPYLSFLAPLNS